MSKEKKAKYSQANQEQITDLTAKYQRALADYQNLIKQKEQEKQEFLKYANNSFLQEIIPVYNHLLLSLQHTANQDSWLEGVKQVIKQFERVLSDRGVEKIITQGQAFDHQLMEAISQEITDQLELDNQVAQELSPGWTLHQQVIIPAKVVVFHYQNNN